MPKERCGNRFWTHLQLRNEIGETRRSALIGRQNLMYQNLYGTVKLHKEFMYDFESRVPPTVESEVSSSTDDTFVSGLGSQHSTWSHFPSSSSSSPDCPSFEPFHGGIFDLAFNPDGDVLCAATENKLLLMFDARTQQLIRPIRNAHDDCVNYIRFLDSRLFASCSNDCTIALWDMRNLKSKLRVLTGHTHYVRNIEYDSSLGLLISSSFDGNINLWDINHYGPAPIGGLPSSSFFSSSSSSSTSMSSTSSSSSMPLFGTYPTATTDQCPYTKALYLSCLLRMRLTHDNRKMIICTSEGYLMVIHDLDLLHLESDLKGFQSDLYRLMQKGHSSGFDFGSWLNPLFTAKRNRVELISDFPIENEAHSITSLDVHPQNWSVLSRNISRDENSEWTCVHNIQDYEQPHEMMSIELPKETIFPPHAMFQRNSLRRRPVNSDNVSSQRAHDQSFNAPTSNENELHVSPLIIISARTLNRRAHATILNPNTSFKKIELGSIAPKIYCNLPRITNYLEELNIGPRFIKELCFSPCGRLICSPYEFGFRLLSFDSECSELCDLVYDRSTQFPSKLHEFSRSVSHPNYVVTTKFSPTHCLIASGCLGGRVNFHQPVL